jgi:Cu/Zn superoxide dismutase
MKKMFALLMGVAFMAATSFAQTAQPATSTKMPPHTVKKETKKVESAEHKKANGTADMRYKENKEKKEEAKPAMHTKANGTADMRYKENKDVKKAAPAGPTKKNGTPDMRYKDNKDKKNG